jgi:hypothetical protein
MNKKFSSSGNVRRGADKYLAFPIFLFAENNFSWMS